MFSDKLSLHNSKLKIAKALEKSIDSKSPILAVCWNFVGGVNASVWY